MIDMIKCTMKYYPSKRCNLIIIMCTCGDRLDRLTQHQQQTDQSQYFNCRDKLDGTVWIGCGIRTHTARMNESMHVIGYTIITSEQQVSRLDATKKDIEKIFQGGSKGGIHGSPLQKDLTYLTSFCCSWLNSQILYLPFY